MPKVADWLKKLGMSEYAQRFAESDIDIDVLSELTDQDFDRLGVSLGHRRRMVRAIRELGDLRSCRTRSTHDAFWSGCRGGPLVGSCRVYVATWLSRGFAH